MKLPTFADVETAAGRIKGKVVRTPLLRSDALDRITGGHLYIKPDCLQPIGAFKQRGAFNRLTALTKTERAKGVVAFSSGNHGQAVAFAAKTLGIAATIVMPKTAPSIKIEKTRSHGAKIVLYDLKTENREVIAREISNQTGANVVPSYDDPYILAGQGTSALEVIEDLVAADTTLDAYLVPTGGGGLLAGTSLAFGHFFPKTEIYSVEPEGYDDHAQSFEAGKIVGLGDNPPASICDAIQTPAPGNITFAINQKHVKRGLVVSDDEVRAAMRFAHKNLDLVVEPGGAVALAAVLTGKIETKDQKIGLIITGSNVDDALFQEILAG